MKKALLFMCLANILTACVSAQQTTTNVQNTAMAIVQTGVALTQTALHTVTPPPPTLTPTATFVYPTPSLLPVTPPTAISPFEAEHEAIREVIASYFDKLYYMHNSFQVEGFGDVISSAPDGVTFQETELRKQAVDITWARTKFLRYASYSYTLDYSEIVVFDSGQRARANFSEGNSIVYETSGPSGIVSRMSGVKHIIMLRYEQDKWKIVYDVHDDYSHRSLYAPTPFPEDVLNAQDKILINWSQGQSGPALPKDGMSFIPSDIAQLERWKEYETALAEKLMPQYPRNTVLCEWELTEKSEQKLNVWAICITTVKSVNAGNYYIPAASVPAVINLTSDGTVQSVDIPEYGDSYLSDFWRLFPNGAWKTRPDVSAMEKHLHWRRMHPAEPPLVVLNATAVVTPSP